MPFKKGNSGNPRGRKRGTPNKVTGELKDMILTALSDVGGVSYLAIQAKENPSAFMTLVGKVLPIQANVAGHDGKALQLPAAGVQFVLSQIPGAVNQT